MATAQPPTASPAPSPRTRTSTGRPHRRRPSSWSRQHHDQTADAASTRPPPEPPSDRCRSQSSTALQKASAPETLAFSTPCRSRPQQRPQNPHTERTCGSDTRNRPRATATNTPSHPKRTKEVGHNLRSIESGGEADRPGLSTTRNPFRYRRFRGPAPGKTCDRPGTGCPDRRPSPISDHRAEVLDLFSTPRSGLICHLGRGPPSPRSQMRSCDTRHVPAQSAAAAAVARTWTARHTRNVPCRIGSRC